MKTILKITVLSLLLFALGCSKDDTEVQTPEVMKSDGKALTSFVFNSSDNAALSDNLTATVTESSKTMAASVPNGTDVSALTPTIQVSAKASVSPNGAQDFSSPVTYTVTAEDGSTATYTASITILEIDNSAPLDFDLIAVTDNAVAVDVLPTFSWNAATDPDGDSVTYDLYLDFPETANDGLYAENLTETTFEVTERLGLLQDYIWKVVAKDSKGASTSSATRSFGTRAVRFNDMPVTSNAEFGKRYSHSSVVFDNKIWVIGGLDNNQNRKNDVWSSMDGVNWTEVTSSAPFTPREGHSSVVFDNKIWVIGGYDNSFSGQNDIWFTSDGITWTEATDNAPFEKRFYHSSVVFDNKIWVIGGFNNSAENQNDVWASSDGNTWSLVNQSPSFEERTFHSSLVFDNKIWVIGGGTNSGFSNDVWYSDDGISWLKASSSTSFTERISFPSVVFDNKIWVVAGFIGNSTSLNDIWISTDGIDWSEATGGAPFDKRSGHSSVVLNDKVFVIGGFGNGEAKSDVWTFD